VRLLDWLDERAGVRAVWRWIADEPVPGGARAAYVFGSVLTYLFAQQVVLGVVLATAYSPSTTDAWASVAYIQDRMAAGWFLRGLHHHGSSAMIVVLALHALQVVWYGAYRRPRELNWWTGLAMAAVVGGFALTGYLLPWDQKGYFATQVATSILGTVPGGEAARIVLQGGAEYGNLTLTRFYALHVFVLPIALAGLLVLHLWLFRRHGVTPPARFEGRHDAPAVPFFPYQAAWDVAAMAVTCAALVALTITTHGAELYAPAAPASAFVARPEWYFLFLFQLLKYFEGPAQIVGTVLIPGLVGALLLVLPWLDRAPSRAARRRWPVLGAFAVLVAGVAALTLEAVAQDAANRHFQEGLSQAREEADAARKWARMGVLPEGGEAVFLNDPEFAARALFREHCAQCHRLDGRGGDEAPDLTDYGSRAWLTALVRDPTSHRFFGGTKHHEMDPQPPSALPDDQLAAVVELIVATMGDEITPPADAALVARGRALWDGDLECSSCHELAPAAEGGAPNLHGHGTRAFVRRMLENPESPLLFGTSAQMPQFAGKLSEAELEALATWVAARRHAALDAR
jgi:ubiquinol-cytochrome c reductase cytochrome b subunit